MRQAKNLPLTKASAALGTCAIHVSRIERGIIHDRDFADRYREWFTAA